MVLVLKNREMQGILEMSELIEAVEAAFKEHALGIAVNRPRSRIRIPKPEAGLTYFFNNLAGAVPCFDAMALRIDSVFSRDVEVAGKKRREYPGDFTGLVFLFNMEDARLLAIMDDHYPSGMRVGATSGVGTRYLARADAKTLGLYGTGEQARTQLMAVAAVRNIEHVKVFSPNPEHRRNFARDMGRLLGLAVDAVDDPREVARGADIVTVATNTIEPVLMGKWLEPGTHINSIVGGDIHQKRQELDDEAVRRSEVIVVNSREQIFLDKQAELYDRIEAGIIQKEDIHELGDLLLKKISGRTNPEQITLFKNNTGMGIQFAATAHKIYQAARKKGIGTELDSNLFITQREGKSYSP